MDTCETNSTNSRNEICVEFLTIKTSQQNSTWSYFEELFYSKFLIKVIYFMQYITVQKL
jgi:hypothetical protein